MFSILTVTTPAADLALLTMDELRAAAGVTGSAQDAKLRTLGYAVAAAIMAECNIAVGTGGEPTLLKETLTETFYWPRSIDLLLARRHDVAVASLTSDGALVAATDYVVNPESGIITRISGGYPCKWYGQTIVVVYDAGFATVPADLKQVALDFFRASYAESERDPFVKSLAEDIPGVMSQTRTFWVGSVPGSSNEGAVPDVVAGQLKRFRNAAIA